MADTIPTEVVNHDIVWLHDQLSRFYFEVAKSQSASVSGVTEADKVRLTSYLNSVRKSVTWIQGLPQLDLPETHPRPYTLEAFPAEVNIENESLNVVLRLLRITSVELTNSQSARYASRLLPFDEQRLLTVIAKIESFIKDYIGSDAVPLDLPESSPEEPLVTDGLTGLNGSKT